VGLFSRLGRRSPDGATPGETPRVAPQVVSRDSGRGTLAGGVLAADRGVLMYGIGGPQTSRPYSPYPAPGDNPPAMRGLSLAAGRPWAGGVTQGAMSDSDASPNNPPYPPVDPAGPASGRGRLAGGSPSGEVGAVTRGPGEQVNLRYLGIDPRVVDPNMFLPPVREVQGYRPGRMVVTYYIDPQRRWGESQPLRGTHQAIRATPYVMPAPGRQTPTGGPNPVVARPTPRPWDQGVIRGLAR
jgi:hypothetical protein